MKIKIQAFNKPMWLTTMGVMALGLFLTAMGHSDANDTQVVNGVKRPHVSEREGWKKISKWRLTQADEDIGKKVWYLEGPSVEKGRGGAQTVILKLDDENNAVIWADLRGIHVFSMEKKKVITPIDFSEFNYRFGFQIDYRVMADPSLSYFLVEWWSKKKWINRGGQEETSKKYYLAEINSSGKLFWCRSISFPKAEKYFSCSLVSEQGDLLMNVSSGGEDIGVMEIWGRNGESKATLPGQVRKAKWLNKGEELYYEWYSGKTLKKYRFGKNGNLINENSK